MAAQRLRRLDAAFNIFCLSAPSCKEAVAFLRRPRNSHFFPDTDSFLTKYLEDRYLASRLETIEQVTCHSRTPGERKDCRRSRDACQEAAAMQWIRHANLQHGRAPQSHEVLSKLSNRFEGREGSPDCQRWVAMTGSEKKHLHRFQRRWALKKGRFGTDAGLSLEMKRTKAICVCLPHTFVCRTHGCI